MILRFSHGNKRITINDKRPGPAQMSNHLFADGAGRSYVTMTRNAMTDAAAAGMFWIPSSPKMARLRVESATPASMSESMKARPDHLAEGSEQ